MSDLLAVRPRETAMPAKYERVAEAIRQQIRAGTLKPGDQLPTTDQYIRDPVELLGEHNVSYGTLRTALMILAAEGWIEGRQGEGRFVSENPPR